jgi:DNA-binding response OmpR family regulator
MLPDVDGLTVLRRLREAGRRTPVLMLTARGTVGERVAGLRTGADDYLVKPFDFEELLARLEALTRRTQGQGQRRLGPVTLDLHRRALVHGAREEALTAREFQVLALLADRGGDVVTRAELLANVWGPSFDGEPNVVDVYIGYVRAKLRAAGAEGVTIRNVRSVGYKLVLEPAGAPPAGAADDGRDEEPR